MKARLRLDDIRARMPMRVRLGVFALLFAVPVLLLAFLQIQRDTNRIQRTATAEVNGAAEGMVRRLTQDLMSAEAVARTLGAIDLGQPGAAAACSLASKQAAMAAGPRTTNFSIAAPTGQVLCSGHPIPPGANVADRQYVQQALRTKRPALSGFLVGRVSGKEGMQLAVPILDAGGRVSAVAIAGLTAASIVSGMRADDGLPLTFALFDVDGVVAGRDPDSGAVPPGRPAATSELFRRREALARTAAEVPGLDGKPRLYASRPVRMGGRVVLWVASAVDVRAVNAATLAAGSLDLGIVLLLAGLVACTALFATRTLVLQRYRGLFSVVAEVAVGNYSARVPVIVQDEVGAVEVALNNMLAAVQTDRAALEQANRALLQESAGRQASEAALKTREQELGDARRLAGLGSWFLNGDGTVHWSQECFAIFGRDPAMGPPSRGEQRRLLTPKSFATMQDGLRRIVADGRPHEVELEGIRPDQTGRWIVARGEAVCDAAGSVIGVRGTALDITERKLAELAVARSQRQLRHLLDGLGPSIFVGLLTPDGVLVEANRAPLEAANLLAQDVLGKPFENTPWWHNDTQVQQQLRAAIERAAKGQASRFDVRLRGANGEFIDLDFSLQPLHDERGKVIFLIPSGTVITERKRVEFALRESEAEFRTLADSMPQIVWVIHPDGSIIYFNRRWTDYTGMTLDQSSGYRWHQPLHPDDKAGAVKAWQLVAAKGGTYVSESRLRGTDGSYRWWLLRGEAQRDRAGVITKWVGTSTDIHDLKLAEQEISRANRELQQQQNELRVLFDLMPARILFMDTENRILRINRQGAATVGLPIEQIEGRRATEIYPAYGASGDVTDMEVIRTGEPQLGRVQMVQGRDGQETWVQRDRVPYRDASGKVIGIVLMTQDITARKRDQDALRELNTDLESRVRRRTEELNQARSQAEEASHAKSDFLAAMSHEIRTPMSGLLGLLELLQLSVLDEGQHSTLGLARESGGALLSMIDDILDFSKIEANRLDLNLVAASVKAIVENACRLHSQVASSKNLVLHLDMAAGISPLLAVDPLRLGQILNNFLNNAIKFTERGRVEVKVELAERRGEAEQLRFTVRDTGIGMTREQLGRLFRPFAQADAATSSRFGGTGLGLVIARRLAELMGGQVEIDSEPDVGTTVTMLLSLEVCDDAGAEHQGVRSGRETLDLLVAGRRVAPSVQVAEEEGTLLLVVDDHPTNRLVLQRQLASLGYAAQAAVDGIEALALWRSGRFAAVITDCNMPRMNGYELAAEIRKLERLGGLRRVPIIACTANAQRSAIDLCIGAGMDDCLVKPADLTMVSRILDRWVPLGSGQPAPRAAGLPGPDPRSAPAPAEGLLDTALLAEISGGDLAVQRQLLDDFRRANQSDASALRAAAAGRDLAAVVESSHRIRGASMMMGATRLSEVCGRLQTAGAAGDAAAVRIAMDSFDTELARLNDYLAGFA